jgi:hypothetical protein
MRDKSAAPTPKEQKLESKAGGEVGRPAPMVRA